MLAKNEFDILTQTASRVLSLDAQELVVVERGPEKLVGHVAVVEEGDELATDLAADRELGHLPVYGHGDAALEHLEAV